MSPQYLMCRSKVREMKRVMTGVKEDSSKEEVDAARACAVALVARSISFGHARLAILRLAGAAQLGADIPSAQWEYGWNVISTCKDPALQELFSKAVAQSKSSESTVST